MTYNALSLKQHRIKKLILIICCFVFLSSTSAASQIRPAKITDSCKALRAMSRVYMAGGNYTKAQPLAENALTLAKSKETSDLELCKCFIDLAYLYKNQGRFSEAEDMCKRGLELFEESQDLSFFSFGFLLLLLLIKVNSPHLHL